MPGPEPPVLGNPYPSINDVMNFARARVNDMMNDTDGDLLANDAPASQTYLTAAWKWLQAKCDTAGVQTFIKVITLYGLPIRFTDDVANEARITWQGCSDGVNQYDGPALPQDMISPKSFWRRQSASPAAPETVNTCPFWLMTQATDGLPVWLDTNVYDWRDDGVYFYAECFVQDWKMRYSAYRAPLDISMPDSQVPIMMSEDCLGARVAFEFANARGAVQAHAMEAWADKAFGTISQRATRIKGRQSIRRQGYSRGNNFNGTYPNIPTNNN